jgi:hypothetical protein
MMTFRYWAHYLESFGEKYKRPIMPWASDFVGALLAHSWPANVQQHCVATIVADKFDSDQRITLRL